jgi:voltage-gated potassium channel Kch
MTWLDALYFTSETITTVGYGDFSFAQQSTSLRLFAVALMFAGVTVSAVLVARLPHRPLPRADRDAAQGPAATTDRR